MNGAESLVHTLLGSGVDTCFANPGTSEMHFVAALDRVPGMRCVLGLFEGVVTGAADGYARMAEKPAATLLHCGPGLANGLANLHNARRANSADRQLRRRSGDLSSPARCAADRRYRGLGARRLGLDAHRAPRRRGRRDGAAAVQAARTSPGADRDADPAVRHLLGRGRHRCGGAAGSGARRRRPRHRPVHRPRCCAEASRRCCCWRMARCAQARWPTRIALRRRRARGCWRRCPTAALRAARGGTPIDARAVPGRRGAGDAARRAAIVILVGARKPVVFFAYPGKPGSLIPPDAEAHVLARPEQDLPQRSRRWPMRWARRRCRRRRANGRPRGNRGGYGGGVRPLARGAAAGTRDRRRRGVTFGRALSPTPTPARAA